MNTTPPDTETQKPFLEKGSHTATCRNQLLCPSDNSRVESKYAETTDCEMASNILSDWNDTKSQKPSGEGGTPDFK